MGYTLLNLPLLEIVNIISEEVDKLTNDYDHLKILHLERFQIMAEKFRQKFISHKKDHSANWRDLAFDLRNYLEEWVNGMEVDHFEALKELIVVDQIKRNLHVEMKDPFIDDIPKVKNVDVLVRKPIYYEAARRSIRTIKKKSYSFENQKHEISKPKNS